MQSILGKSEFQAQPERLEQIHLTNSVIFFFKHASRNKQFSPSTNLDWVRAAAKVSSCLSTDQITHKLWQCWWEGVKREYNQNSVASISSILVLVWNMKKANVFIPVCYQLQCQRRSSQILWAHRPLETGPYWTQWADRSSRRLHLPLWPAFSWLLP